MVFYNRILKLPFLNLGLFHFALGVVLGPAVWAQPGFLFWVLIVNRK
jgi:hypothetical protein